HPKLARALSKAAGKEYRPDRLPFDLIEFVDGGKAIRFEVGDVEWKCDLKSYECTQVKQAARRPRPNAARRDKREVAATPPEETATARQPPRRGPAGRESRSPDRKWTALVKEHNVYVRARDTGKEVRLSQNGTEGNAYGALSWSPDSKTLVAYRI